MADVLRDSRHAYSRCIYDRCMNTVLEPLLWGKKEVVKSVGVTSTKKNLVIYIEACDAREKLTEVVRKCSKCFTVSAHKCNHLRVAFSHAWSSGCRLGRFQCNASPLTPLTVFFFCNQMGGSSGKQYLLPDLLVLRSLRACAPPTPHVFDLISFVGWLKSSEGCGEPHFIPYSRHLRLTYVHLHSL